MKDLYEEFVFWLLNYKINRPLRVPWCNGTFLTRPFHFFFFSGLNKVYYEICLNTVWIIANHAYFYSRILLQSCAVRLLLGLTLEATLPKTQKKGLNVC